MKKVTLKSLRQLVSDGSAVLLDSVIPGLHSRLEPVATSHGTYGTTGLLSRDIYTGQLYACIGRTTTLFYYL